MPSYNELLKKANSYDTFQEQIYFYVSWISKKKLFVLRNSSYSLRGNNILTLPLPKTTNNGPECIRCQAAKMWNSLSYRMRTITSYKDFKAAIKKKKMNL